MQFVQLKNKKVYHTWVTRYYSYKIYIYELVVMQVFHFTVYKDTHTIYSSINDNLVFSEFDEAVKYIEKWVIKNCEDKKGGTAYEEI